MTDLVLSRQGGWCRVGKEVGRINITARREKKWPASSQRRPTAGCRRLVVDATGARGRQHSRWGQHRGTVRPVRAVRRMEARQACSCSAQQKGTPTPRAHARSSAPMPRARTGCAPHQSMGGAPGPGQCAGWWQPQWSVGFDVLLVEDRSDADENLLLFRIQFLHNSRNTVFRLE